MTVLPRFKLDENLPSAAELPLRGAMKLISTEAYEARLWVVQKERVRIRK